MSAWLSANLINIALIAAIVLIAALVLRGMLRSRKAGKSACGCDCASCGGSCAASRSRHAVRTAGANGEASENATQYDERPGGARCGGNGSMTETTVRIEGMSCGMCEARICETIRKAVPDAKKVSASHRKGTAVFLTETSIDREALQSVIHAAGYTFVSCESALAEKAGLRGRRGAPRE